MTANIEPTKPTNLPFTYYIDYQLYLFSYCLNMGRSW